MAPTSANIAPSCLDMQAFISCMSKMPQADNGASLASSPAVLNLLNSPRHIHIYGVRLTIDELLHVGTLIHYCYKRIGRSSRGPGLVIVVDDVSDAVAKVTALAARITNERLRGFPDSGDSVYSFSRVAIIRGPKPPSLCASAAAYNASIASAASALRTTLARFSHTFGVNRAIWHSHFDPSLLVHIINTSPQGSPPLDAISIFGALLFTDAPSPRSRGAITCADPRSGYGGLPNIWPLLLTAASRAHRGRGIPVAFFSDCSMRVQMRAYSVHRLFNLPDLFPALLPEAVWKPVLGQVMDQLLVAAFRLLAGGDLSSASPKRAGAAVVWEVKRRLGPRTAQGWAKLCVDARSYGEPAIASTVRGALPGFTDPLPTLAALVQTLRNPTPRHPATAISRLALGPRQPRDVAPSLRAVRVAAAPRSSATNLPAASVALRPAPSGVLHVVATPPPASRDESGCRHPRAVQVAVGERWATYAAAAAEAEARGHVGCGFADTSGGYGVTRETARAWMAAVPGAFAAAVEEWGRVVAGGMVDVDGRRRLEGGVERVVAEAREGGFTRVCRGVLGL